MESSRRLVSKKWFWWFGFVLLLGFCNLSIYLVAGILVGGSFALLLQVVGLTGSIAIAIILGILTVLPVISISLFFPICAIAAAYKDVVGIYNR
jgi:hypothetical protein